MNIFKYGLLDTTQRWAFIKLYGSIFPKFQRCRIWGFRYLFLLILDPHEVIYSVFFKIVVNCFCNVMIPLFRMIAEFTIESYICTKIDCMRNTFIIIFVLFQTPAFISRHDYQITPNSFFPKNMAYMINNQPEFRV